MALPAFFNTAPGKALIGLAALAAILAAFFLVRPFLRASDAGEASRDRLFICAETRKPFHHTLQLGEMTPIYSPHSGKDTGYPAELCYWTADGQPKTTPTPVLLNSYVNDSSPTFCPDCGRLVVGLNPPARAGTRPPPTREEYATRHSKNSH